MHVRDEAARACVVSSLSGSKVRHLADCLEFEWVLAVRPGSLYVPCNQTMMHVAWWGCEGLF
eukprot:5119823-Prymnesium_polylepis.1